MCASIALVHTAVTLVDWTDWTVTVKRVFNRVFAYDSLIVLR